MNVITGAFSYSGKYISKLLLDRAERVRTLTNHPDPSSPLRSQIEVAPLDFADESALARNMEGAAVLYNTYWVRFAHGQMTHARAVQNTKILIRAAERAGVKRFVHVSITNPSLTSKLPYFRGKAELEEAIKASSLSYAILRPAVLFGHEDILINNIAWLLRRFPLFAIPGDGRYRIQPIFVEDFAALAVEHGHRTENQIVDAVGPEAYTYNDLIEQIRMAVGSKARTIHVTPSLLLLASRFFGAFLNDVVLTKDEITGLMADLLVSSNPATGETRLSDWITNHASSIGQHYASELARHFRTK